MSSTPNQAFLERYVEEAHAARLVDAVKVILPLDKHLIELRLTELQAKTQEMGRERAEIAEQSGDSWHDGAFNESDREVHDIDRERARLIERLRGTLVDYPEPGSDRVSLGSQVDILNGGRPSTLQIVGFASVHQVTEEIKVSSLEAPIVEGIMGKQIGEVALLRLGAKPREVEIVSIDQDAVRQRDEELGTA